MRNEEYKIQTAIIVYMEINHPQVLRVVSPAAGFKVSAGLAMKMVRMGYQKGTSDLIILEAKGRYHGFVIELKSPTGVLSPEQRQYLARAVDKGYLTGVYRSAEEAIAAIENYLNSPL